MHSHMYALCQYLVCTPKTLFNRENSDRNSRKESKRESEREERGYIQLMVEKYGLGVRSALLLVVLAVSLLLLPPVLPPLPPPPPCLLLVPVAIMVVLLFLGIFSTPCITSDISASHLRFPLYDHEMNADASMLRFSHISSGVHATNPLMLSPSIPVARRAV